MGQGPTAALTAEEVASPLARRPYDLRHAAVSTWLNGGVPAPQVAAWAGHSVDVLLRVYAKCIAGQDDAVRRRVEEALRDGGFMIASVMRPWTPVDSRSEPDTAGHSRTAPDRVSAGQGPFALGVAGEGFEPS